MKNALAILQAGLAHSFADGPRFPEPWPHLAEMVRVGKDVRIVHGTAGISVNPRTIMAAVEDFRKSGKIAKHDIKYVCHGVGMLLDKGWSLLADETLRGTVVRRVEQQTSVYRQLRCFQALLSSYFSFLIHEASPESKTGWHSLREWLRAECGRIMERGDIKPLWFDTLLRYPELFTDQPCDKFGDDLLRGVASGLKEVQENLSIPENSWLIEEAVFAQMKAAAKREDTEFKTTLPDLLTIAMGHRGVSISENLKMRCIAHLVSRYARCSDRPEQSALRDAATLTIGNPWLHRTNWDAYVRVDDKPDDQAREMVFFWLKGRLVSDFFELLSAEGLNDTRRVAYWLRFVPFVDDMWFALGSLASQRKGSEFGEFRKRAKGRLLSLEGTTPDNNAFIMRIGNYLAVEFGASGNAFYLFRWDSLSSSLLEFLNSGRARQGVHITELKIDDNESKIQHRDSRGALKSWEQKFDDKLVKLIRQQPERRPACVPELEALLPDHIEVTDNRGKGGALWVGELEQSSRIAKELKKMGFSYRSGRGWYKE